MKLTVLTLAAVMLGFSPWARSQSDSAASSPAQASPVASAAASAAEDFWRLNISPYTFHFSRTTDHKYVYLLGAERQYADSTLLGAAFFSNSFGQPSAYVYGGKHLTNFTRFEPLFAQWTVGVAYGYKGQYENKVPLNYKGFSPVGVVSLGWQFNRTYSAQMNLLGTSAVMFQVSANLR